MSTRIYVPQETTACALGADAVAAVIEARIAAGTLDAELIRNGSRGAFHLEPLLEIAQDMTPELELELQPRYAGAPRRIGFPRLTAERAAQLFAGPQLPNSTHPGCCGAVDTLPWLATQTRLTFARVGHAAPLDYEYWRRSGGGRGLEQSLAMRAPAIIDALCAAGLRGRGGAAFPAHIKWQTVLDTPADARYIVCNADEGDSGTFADRLLMECDPLQLIEGMAIAGCALDARVGYLYIRSEYPRAIEVMKAALLLARTHGLLGANVFGGAHSFDIEIRVGGGAYVCGEETALLESIEGRRGMVRRKPPVPAVSGLFGKPTLVHNVLTLAAVTSILADGAAAYAQHGVDRSRGTMPLQLGGAFASGGLVELPFGVQLRAVLATYGGGSASGRPLTALQVGGPLGAYLGAADWTLPLDYEAMTAAGALLGHGGIVAFDDRVDMAAQAEFAMRFCAHESCGKCTPCRVGAVRGVELIQAMRANPQPQQRVLLDDLLETMELGSLCALGGLTPLPVRSILHGFPGAFHAAVQPETSASKGRSAC